MIKRAQTITRKIIQNTRTALMGVWLRVPFGNICSLKHGAITIELKKNLWVIVSDGRSSDALPINFVSEELQMKIAEVMRSMGYPEPESPTTAALS